MSRFRTSCRATKSERKGLAAATLSVLTAMNLGGAAFAQEKDHEATGGVETVVVTAERRAEDQRTVPIAVTAISPKKLEALSLRNVDTVQMVTPSLNYGSSNAFSDTFIRGIGSNSPLPGLETSVATYVDGAYVARGVGAIFDLLDTSSVQILNGPQGTLYGRNATGGAIVITTADPVDDYEGHALVEYGNFNRVLAEAVLNAPLTDTIDARFAGRYTRYDGYKENLALGTKAGESDAYDVRLKIGWHPSNQFSSVLSAETSRTIADENEAQNGVPAPYCLGCLFTGEKVPGFYEFYSDMKGPDSRINDRNVNLHSKATFGIFNLDIVSAYRDLTFRDFNDLDATAAPLLTVHFAAGGKTFTQDVTLTSDSGTWVDGLLGVSYLNDQSAVSDFDTGAFVAPLQMAFGDVPRGMNSVLSDSISVFGEVSVKPLERLKITLGGRYNHDERTLRTNQNLAASVGFGGGAPTMFTERASFDSVTPRAVIDYDFGLVNTYASYNRGFKAGGFNNPTFAPGAPVSPEKTDSYEIGAKYSSPDNSFLLDVDGFISRSKDLQVSVADIVSGGIAIKNAASASAKGVETNLTYVINENLNIFAGGDYLFSRFVHFPNASVAIATPAGLISGIEDLSGTVTPRSPRWTLFVGSSAETLITDSWRLHLDGVLHFTSRYDFFPGAGGSLMTDQQASMALVNASGYVAPVDDKFQIGFYVNNLTGKKYYQTIQSSPPFGVYFLAAMPRTYGLRLKYNL